MSVHSIVFADATRVLYQVPHRRLHCIYHAVQHGPLGQNISLPQYCHWVTSVTSVVHTEECTEHGEYDTEGASNHDPQSRRFQEIKDVGSEHGLGAAVCILNLERDTYTRNVVGHGTQSGCEPVLMESVPEPRASVEDTPGALDG